MCKITYIYMALCTLYIRVHTKKNVKKQFSPYRVRSQASAIHFIYTYIQYTIHIQCYYQRVQVFEWIQK